MQRMRCLPNTRTQYICVRRHSRLARQHFSIHCDAHSAQRGRGNAPTKHAALETDSRGITTASTQIYTCAYYARRVPCTVHPTRLYALTARAAPHSTCDRMRDLDLLVATTAAVAAERCSCVCVFVCACECIIHARTWNACERVPEEPYRKRRFCDTMLSMQRRRRRRAHVVHVFTVSRIY